MRLLLDEALALRSRPPRNASDPTSERAITAGESGVSQLVCARDRSEPRHLDVARRVQRWEAQLPSA
jgi:hypothetical protein